jgi:general secretion pathway protein K
MKSRGSILVIVMIILLFTATALVAFLDKASNDLLVDARVIGNNRLRVDAYSALEVTLAVLADFREADGGLHSQNEGWGKPLDWAQWTPPTDGRTVDVSFEDESGKISLNHITQPQMMSMFENWNMTEDDAQHLSDVLLVWMRENHIAKVAPAPDYEQSAIPYDQPTRALRSYDELADIDYARDQFYDANGRPNDLWWRFRSDFSLFNYPMPNINGTNQDIVVGLGQFPPTQMDNVTDYLAGKGDFVEPNPLGVQWFENETQIVNVLGPAGNPKVFGTTISALRIFVTVHDGSSQFRLEAVISPQGGASTVQTTATDRKKNTQSDNSGESGSQELLPGQIGQDVNNSVPTKAQISAAQSANLRFPFTILEIRENNEILTPPPPPPPPPT